MLKITEYFIVVYLIYNIVHRELGASLVAQMVKSLHARGDLHTGLIPGLGRCPGEGNGNPFQYSCIENPMDREARRATVHRVTKSQKQLNN